MKVTVKFFRIVTCILASLYTLLMCYHVSQNVRFACYRITPVGEEYVMGGDHMPPEAWFFIIPGVVLLALCVVTVVFLFRKGIPAAVIASAATLTSAVYGVCLNTQLAEVTLWREIVRALGIPFEACLAVKPSLAGLCIVVTACYAVLYLVTYKKSSNAGEDINEQNS